MKAKGTTRAKAATAPSSFRDRIVGHGHEAPDQLLAHPENWRIHTALQEEALEGVLSDVGWVRDVLVNRRTSHVLDGHLRVALAIRKGEPRVPVSYVDLSVEEERLVLATLDPMAALAGTDAEKLASLVSSLHESAHLSSILDALKLSAPVAAGRTDADEVPAARPTTIKRGDVFTLGRHRLACVDATSGADVKRACGSLVPLLMVTDPPYGVSYDATWREKLGHAKMGKNRSAKVTNDDQADWSEAWAIFPGRIAYVWHGGLTADVVAISLKSTGFALRSQIIWNKTVMAMSRGDYHWKHEACWYAVKGTGKWTGDRKQTTVWDIASPIHIMSGSTEEKTAHPTQKPVECMERPIINHKGRDLIVYDPFVGSGTTIIAAERQGVACVAIDIEPVNVQMAIDRWEKFTGQKAVKAS